METIHNPTGAQTSGEAMQSMIRGMLYFLEQELQKNLEEVTKSDALIKVGEKTPLVQRLEGLLHNPLAVIIEAAEKFDAPVKLVLNKFAQAFFSYHSTIIDQVYKSNKPEHDLYFFVVLKEDSDENRGEIFTLISDLGYYGITEKYPVKIQFVPPRLKGKLTGLIPVEL